jgi:hypothetical protein
MGLDPYAYLALAVHLVVVAAGGAGLAGWARRRWHRLQDAVGRACDGDQLRAVVPLADGSAIVCAAGGRAGRAVPGGTLELRPVLRATLARESGGRTRLVLQVGGDDLVIGELEAAARVVLALRADGVQVQVATRGDLPEEMEAALGALEATERQLIGDWLTEGEVLTHVRRGARITVVTTMRVAAVQGGPTVTLTSLPVAVAERVVLEPGPVLRLELDGESASLPLQADQVEALLPAVLQERPLAVRTGRARPPGTVRRALGWCLVGGLVGAGLALGLREALGPWYDRYVWPIVLGGVLTPGLLQAATALARIPPPADEA